MNKANLRQPFVKTFVRPLSPVEKNPSSPWSRLEAFLACIKANDLGCAVTLTEAYEDQLNAMKREKPPAEWKATMASIRAEVQSSAFGGLKLVPKFADPGDLTLTPSELSPVEEGHESPYWLVRLPGSKYELIEVFEDEPFDDIGVGTSDFQIDIRVRYQQKQDSPKAPTKSQAAGSSAKLGSIRALVLRFEVRETRTPFKVWNSVRDATVVEGSLELCSGRERMARGHSPNRGRIVCLSYGDVFPRWQSRNVRELGFQLSYD